ncbi:MAG: 50S ribosomal protein L22 [Flavobacteriales bacterium]|nr:50S ribosomal protein L22 [Flavobacteriales bacterium]MBP6642141.1 50S ribosomal protein L22 [Flavobacteriales bacterium]MBP7154876.1 50S ribosomal protein L22 [Flavobacteriales bacterium]HQV74679.1 50S ribosomal protein L22 [Flavobacteriales bacterium]HQW39945.1 50S ribosomal protein L22 [Flavobacteriales bacterium]
MGARKKISAEKRKEAMKTVAIAHLRNVPSSPRRMRQVADLIRGVEVDKALGILRFSTRHSSRDLEKLLISAISNWQAKNDGARADEAGLVVKSIQVNEARGLKRMLPAPQGRAYRMKKRSNHVSLIVEPVNQEA